MNELNEKFWFLFVRDWNLGMEIVENSLLVDLKVWLFLNGDLDVGGYVGKLFLYFL